jgi:hypothetical protein
MNGIDVLLGNWATSAGDDGYAEVPPRVLLNCLDPCGPAAVARRTPRGPSEAERGAETWW